MTAEIDAVLRKVATHVERVAPDSWSAAVLNGVRLDVAAHVAGDWLALQTTLAAPCEPAAPDEWRQLQWNATLGGGARFVLDGAAPGHTLRADVPLDAGIALVHRLGQVVDAFEAAKACLHEEPQARPLAPAPALLDRCRETGWTVHARESGAIEVDLDVSADFHLASIQTREDEVVARVDLPGHPLSGVHRRAVAVLLLRASGALRMVRATAAPEPGLDVALSTAPSAAELSHAFAALSVGCRMAAREAMALAADDELATIYLRHWDERRARRLRAA